MRRNLLGHRRILAAIWLILLVQVFAVIIIGLRLLDQSGQDSEAVPVSAVMPEYASTFLGHVDSLLGEVPLEDELLPVWTRMAENAGLRVLYARLGALDSAGGLVSMGLILRVEGGFSSIGTFCATVDRLRPVAHVLVDRIERNEDRVRAELRISQRGERL